MKMLKRWYYNYQVDNALVRIKLLKTVNRATDAQLSNNKRYIKAKSKLVYYSTLLWVL